MSTEMFFFYNFQVEEKDFIVLKVHSFPIVNHQHLLRNWCARINTWLDKNLILFHTAVHQIDR